MSAIKRFFEKKKADAKFKLAGGGQRLGDATSASSARAAIPQGAAASASSSGTTGSRSQLSQEQRLAASAALGR